VLKELGVLGKPFLLALNKIDLLSAVEVDKLRGRFPDAVLCSAARNINLDDLRDRIGAELAGMKIEIALEVPFDHGEVVARLHREGEILEQSYTSAGTTVLARIPGQSLGDYKPYLRTETAARDS
jgi:GTP-binding protein HflX